MKPQWSLSSIAIATLSFVLTAPQAFSRSTPDQPFFTQVATCQSLAADQAGQATERVRVMAGVKQFANSGLIVLEHANAVGPATAFEAAVDSRDGRLNFSSVEDGALLRFSLPSQSRAGAVQVVWEIRHPNGEVDREPYTCDVNSGL